MPAVNNLDDRLEQIDRHITTLWGFWRRYPALRLGQLVHHFAERSDPRLLNDDTLLGALKDEHLVQQLEQVLANDVTGRAGPLSQVGTGTARQGED